MSEQDQIRGAIEKLAYKKWETAGRPQGNGANFWLEAEKEIMNRNPAVSQSNPARLPGRRTREEERTAAKKSVR